MGDYHGMEDFKLHLIESITDNFSDDRIVGSGGYGDVYKAEHKGKEIAVKKLHPFQGLDDKQFHNEVRNLIKIRHKNVVRLIGYCYESRHKYIEHNKELVFAKTMERVICFEYMQGGSLDKHIADEPCGLGWSTCYDIIKGTCEGLNHLHSVQETPIYHLDLKPGNVLLDKSMMPKIGDLGLSKLVASTETHKTEMLKGTKGYMPPEYIDSGRISKKFDVFSLGVIILRMMAGNKGYFSCSNTPPKQFIDLVEKIQYVSENWKERLQAVSQDSSYEMDILRVRKCVEIALRCVDTDRKKRPTIQDIVREVKELEADIEKMMSAPSPQSKDLTVQSPRLKMTTSSAKCMMLTSRSLRIANNQPQYWRWISLPADPRFAECAELLSVYFLAVIGEIPPRDLSAGTSYAVYLVYKLASSTSGLRGCVQTSSLRLHGERIVPGSTRGVSLDPEAHGSASDVTYPVARGDGWLELRLAEFENDDEMLAERGVIVDLREENDSVQKKGLIIGGMEFRSN